MRKSTIVFCLLLSSMITYSQAWLELGGKAMFGLTGFYNKNIINDGQYNYQLSTGLTYGPVVGVNFGDLHGINIEGMFGTHSQNYEFLNQGDKISAGVKWKASELLLLYRYYAQGGAFVELGPKFSFVSEVVQAENVDRARVDEFYSSQYTSGVFGVGGFLAGSDIFTVKMGLRLEYAFNDFVSEKGQAEGYPAPYTTFDSYTTSHPFRAGVYMEINFGVGGFAKVACGQRRFVFGSPYR